MADLLKILSDESGVSGAEKRVREIILDVLKDYPVKTEIDSMGNVIVFKKGKNSKKTIMIAAHMDEPGFIVSGITDSGYIKFKSVGTVDPRLIVSKCVAVGEDKIKGVIGMKAIHLQKRDERENVVKVSDLFIDIGAKNKAAALKQVKLGDYIAFRTEFKRHKNNVTGKALDSRIGCYCLLEILKENFENDIYAVFSAQKETGFRGAQIAAYRINPDEAIVLDTVESADMYGVKDSDEIAKMGKGVAVKVMDRRYFSDEDILKVISDIAKEENIPLQTVSFGVSDGGAVQTAADGTKTLCLAVACRYSHSPVCAASLDDIAAMTELLKMYLRNGD